MGSIRRLSYYGSGSTEGTAFIQCIYGTEPQIHELWCLGLDRIIRGVHPTAHVEFPDGTVGEFLTDYLAENGHLIEITGQLSVNDIVQFLGFSKPRLGNWNAVCLKPAGSR